MQNNAYGITDCAREESEDEIR